MVYTKKVFKKLTELHKINHNGSFIFNRNPKNLEKMNVAYNNQGFHLENPGRSYWHKLSFEISSKYVTAKIIHIRDGPIIEASTKEWAVQQFLSKPSDTSAYANLAKVLARRCLQHGVVDTSITETNLQNPKINVFLEELKKSGLNIYETPKLANPKPWDVEQYISFSNVLHYDQ